MRLSRRVTAIVWVLWMLFSSISAQAIEVTNNERRVALVIGNDQYKHVTPLNKAVNDGVAMSAELKRAGFSVIFIKDGNRREMNDAINSFRDKTANGGIGVFFFAGHGVQVDGTNYLLPVDVDANRVEDLDTEAINVPYMMEKIGKSKARFTLMVLDACRNNPFPKKAGRSIGSSRGMAMQDAPKGLMVLYSAGANQEALDSLSPEDKDPNGLFTREFIKQMRNTDLRVDEMLRKVRQSVAQKAEAIRHEQNPALYEQTTGDFFLYPASMRNNSGGNAAVRFDPKEADVVFWNSVKDSNEQADLQAYLNKFPKGDFAALAKRRLERLSENAIVGAPSAGKSEAECSREAAASGVHPTDLLDFVNACKEGKAFKVAIRKTAADCIKDAKSKGLVGMEMADYTKRCYSSGALK